LAQPLDVAPAAGAGVPAAGHKLDPEARRQLLGEQALPGAVPLLSYSDAKLRIVAF
jgi:hypothetical protein